ncbi:MAG: AAC(3) family N-acetyltransferase, partial [Thermomicrobiales bacterium]
VSAGSPLVRLAESGGWILLVGVGHNRNTTIHSGECFAPAVYLSVPQSANSSSTAILRVNGEERIIPLLEKPGCSVGFGAIEGALRKRGAIRDGRLGDSHTQAMRGADVIETAVELIRADPTALLCSDPTCYRCTQSRELIASMN